MNINEIGTLFLIAVVVAYLLEHLFPLLAATTVGFGLYWVYTGDDHWLKLGVVAFAAAVLAGIYDLRSQKEKEQKPGTKES